MTTFDPLAVRTRLMPVARPIGETSDLLHPQRYPAGAGAAGARFPSTDTDDLKTRGRTGDDTTAPATIIVIRLLDQRQFQQAERVCLEWIKLDPENPLAWRLLGRARERQGRAGDACLALDNATRPATASQQ
jgi:uncharacterized protein HemY